jgi:glutamate-ammonia-ligase adenylyltransferase
MHELPSIDDPVLKGQFELLSSASRFARQLCQRRPGILEELLSGGALTEGYGESTLADKLREELQGCGTRDELGLRLRRFRQREILRILWRDFNRTAPTMETTRDMSLLAECCIGQALDWLHREMVGEHGEPRDKNGEAQQLLVVAMGKLGAWELNLSSDVDLIFTYPGAGTTDGERRPLSNQEFFIKLGQRLISALDQTTAEGFVFRVDMRLRPYGQSGALVLNFSALEEYYQDQGRDWERYALIKARVITGPQAQRDFLTESLRPFVYRRYIDFGVIESLRDMKQMINTEVRRRGLQENVKLGPGGIREIEFIAQCFQLIRGGRDVEFQQRELLKVLDACGVEGCLPEEAVTELKQAYLFLRDTEHAIQGYDDKQSQSLPRGEEERAALLRAMNFSSWEAFSAALEEHRRRVSDHFSKLIAAPVEGEQDRERPSIWPNGIEEAALESLGFADGDRVGEALLELRDSSRLRYLQVESRQRLDQFMPRLLTTCAEHEQADEVLLRLLPLVQAVVRRSAYLMLLLENPSALQELVSLCAASPWISEQLARQPVLLDELLDTRSLYSAPDRDVLQQELQQQVQRLPQDDLEAHMETLRYFKASQMLHVAASEVSGRLPLMKVSDKLSFLAEVILEQALAVAWHDLTNKHGEPAREGEGSGFIIVGYGKLGGIELGHGSDLDLVFIYDAAGGSTDGGRPIDNAVFYTRLGQRIIHILDTRTALGQLYEVDMRLRPSGESGMLVTSFKGFKDYQLNSAWTWEHQALVRGRFIAGDTELGQDFAAFREEVLSLPRDEAKLREEVIDMRKKMRDHLLPAETVKSGNFHLKHGLGGIVDIEFMVQYAVLAWSHRVPGLAFWSDNVRILETLQEAGLFTAAESTALTDAYIAYRSAAHQLSLQQQPGEVEPGRFESERAAVTAKWNELLGDGI